MSGLNQSLNVSGYTDFQGLARLKTTAKNDPRAALVTVAKQFETQFIGMMMKSMRDATPQDGLMDSEQSKTFQSMMDQEVAEKIAAHGGIGLAGVIEQQLRQDTPGAQPKLDLQQVPRAFPLHPVNPASQQPIDATPRAFKLPPRNMALKAFALPERAAGLPVNSVKQAASAPVQETALLPNESQPVAYWSSPEAFVDAILPHAQAAAKALGVPAKVLVAQSALETGWGKHLPTDAQGRVNFNFFGIKADPSWQGGRQTVNTLEFEGGAMVSRKASFRAYPSVGDSFQDYVQFLQSNPRYQAALSAKGNPEAFVRALQKAGYATDPQYADKLIAIMNSGRIPDSSGSS
ncbi:flagellar assembly peptidoglycan hydrolase FlgJ [Halothiobacillus sp. DCM-1]|uniref:flagellar assembly peptidoglycan hydrolase FlgJ n=1 Tax=Halothiobacillus sp. DCM-1 TaxID=3112558 RepID=UPI00325345BE